jgi:hypothetical protein
MTQHAKPFRLALLLCLCTALWFALGSTLKVWVAHSSGKTIEMVVCSGAGMKKIYVTMLGADPASHEVSVKHCSNTPLALMTEEVNTLQDLAYTQPTTPATWHWSQGLRIVRDWLHNGKPPPGRAPPAFLSA